MKQIADYHLHSKHSIDSDCELENHIKRAQKLGITELCVTEHAEFDPLFAQDENWYLDFEPYQQEVQSLRKKYPEMTIRMGYELGLPDSPALMEEIRKKIPPYSFDFVIASLHNYENEHIFRRNWYENISFAEACRKYVLGTYEYIQNLKPEDYSVIGHINAPAKARPAVTRIRDQRVRLHYFLDEFDTLARYVLEQGNTFELNTSAWRRLQSDAITDIEWLSRLRELGAEYISIGSDAHDTFYLGYRFEDAREIAKRAGFRYYASYQEMKVLPRKL